MPTSQRSRRTGFRRLGLQARLIAAFALGAFVLSTLLATVAYSLVRENLVRQRERAATSGLFLNANYVRQQLATESIDQGTLLDTLRSPGGASPVLLSDGEWFGDVGRGREELPLTLRTMVEEGKPALMRFELDGETQLAVGVPLPAVDAAYFEIASLHELEKTLSELGYALLAAGLLTTLAGVILGILTSRRVLQPLAEVRQAAVAIAGGRLDTRVAVDDDADLGALVNSFNDMARALQERIERDGRFASDVSHELRSPLTTLAASVGVLEGRREELPERARAALDLLVADVARFSAMVEDLLEISRFDAGAVRLQLDEVRISELVCNAVESAPHPSVDVEIEAAAAEAVVQADKRRMSRVLANLLDNAGRYGGGATRVTVSLDGEGGRVQVAVEDNGPGIAEEDRERVFDRFARGSTEAGRRGAGEGTGLGLALVKEHVNLHGGRVWVEDRPSGPGARVVVELSVLATGEQPVEAAEEPETDLGPAAVPAAEVDEVQV